jgi:hypothetical protein
MEDRTGTKSKDIWIPLALLVVMIGIVLALLLPAISATAKLLVLGSGLIAAGILGRRRLRQG